MFKNSRKAFALATLLMFIPVLLMMLATLLVAVLGQTDQTRLTYEQTSALYLAEAAVVDAVNELEIDPTWNLGFNKKRIPGVEGFYSIKFHTVGPYNSLESVNNLDGAHPNNYRGAGYIPAGQVSLVASATVGRHTRVVEALVKLGGGLLPVDMPVITTGAIALAGNVTVRGVKGQSDATPVNGSMHSNFADPGVDLIKWDNSGGGIATFTGRVSSVGANANAINLGATPLIGAGVPVAGQARVAQSIDTAAASKSVPRVNIVGKVTAKSALPPVSVPPVGNVNMASGDRFMNAPSVIQGDLVLNGTNLYVQGDLKVNGTVRGDGSLYVSGNTTFQGDAAVRSSSPEKVALYSHGSVVLSGYDGTGYMETIASSNTAFATAWGQTKTALADLQTELAAPVPRLGSANYADQVVTELGPRSVGTSPRSGHNRDNLGILLGLLGSQPASTQKTAIVSRLNQMRDVFTAVTDGSAAETNAAQQMRQNRVVLGAADAVIDRRDMVALPILGSFVNSIDYSKIGSSAFQGLVYTNGAFVSKNEVDIRGAVVVDDDGSQTDLVITPPSGPVETYKPGSLNLLNGSGLTYVEDFFKPSGTGGGPGGSKIILWMGR